MFFEDFGKIFQKINLYIFFVSDLSDFEQLLRNCVHNLYDLKITKNNGGAFHFLTDFSIVLI